jgi:hypothetical protein
MAQRSENAEEIPGGVGRVADLSAFSAAGIL